MVANWQDWSYFLLAVKELWEGDKKIPDWVFEEVLVPWIIEEGQKCDETAGSFLG